MSYADDGKCHNSEPGTFNHECGETAKWVATFESGHKSGFCDDCRKHGYEAKGAKVWTLLWNNGIRGAER
jgi:hypothetical protein